MDSLLTLPMQARFNDSEINTIVKIMKTIVWAWTDIRSH